MTPSAGAIAINDFAHVNSTPGVRLSGSGDATQTNHVWMRDDVGTFVPTPAVYRGRVILVRDRGEVASIDSSTGKTIWEAAFGLSDTKVTDLSPLPGMPIDEIWLANTKIADLTALRGMPIQWIELGNTAITD